MAKITQNTIDAVKKAGYRYIFLCQDILFVYRDDAEMKASPNGQVAIKPGAIINGTSLVSISQILINAPFIMLDLLDEPTKNRTDQT